MDFLRVDLDEDGFPRIVADDLPMGAAMVGGRVEVLPATGPEDGETRYALEFATKEPERRTRTFMSAAVYGLPGRVTQFARREPRKRRTA